MKTKWWKTPQVSAIWTVIRIWLGVQWITAGWGKITAGWGKITGGFEVNGFLQGAIAKASGEAPIVQGWYAGFLENFALSNAGLFNVLSPLGWILNRNWTHSRRSNHSSFNRSCFYELKFPFSRNN